MKHDPSEDDATDAQLDVNDQPERADYVPDDPMPEDLAFAADGVVDDRAAGAGRQDAATGAMLRRDYLRALGVTGVAGAVGSSTASTAAAQSSLDEAAADQRIRENQQGPLTVEVVDQDGEPVSGASVDVEMQEHDFVWGGEVAADLLVNQYDEGDPYVDEFLDLFNTAVLENIHKWALWEGDQSLADDAVDWLDERGYRIRGHTCIYSVDYAIPGDVQTAMNNGDGQTVRQRSMEHLREIITHYGDQIMEWDVVNEIVHEPELVEAIEGSNVTAHRSNTLVDWYNEADAVIEQNGLDVEIVTNDYNTLTWNPDSYYDQVEFMVNQGVDLDALCHQSHIGPSPPDGPEWSYASIDEMFQFYADLGPRQRITEFDMAGDAWTGYEQQARVLERFLKTAFGHPDFDEFTFWGYWDNAHWQDEAPFFEVDWTEKPALDVYRNLVFDEWWTSESGSTGSDGTIQFDAFLGEHDVTVSTDAGSTTQTTSVTDADGGTRLVVSVEGDGEPSPAEPPSVSPVELDGTYRVENANSGHVLSIENGSASDGASVVQRAYDGAADQHWTFEHLGDGVHRIDNAGSGASMDVLDAQVGDGADVVQWPWNGGDQQRFLVGEADGDLAIVAQHSNRVLDVTDLSTAEGANVQQWTDNGGDHQRWTAVPVDGSSGCGESSSATVDGRTVCDVNGDSYYRDVTGDGSVGQTDVVEFFQVQHRDAWKDPSMFDFSGNGEVGHGDVVSLFEHVATNA